MKTVLKDEQSLYEHSTEKLIEYTLDIISMYVSWPIL